MQLHLHQFIGMTFLKVGFKVIVHFMIYFWFQTLTHLRYYDEILCFHLGNTCHWREHSTGRIFIWPWYYKLVNYPAVWTWYFLNYLMKVCQWLHSHIADDELFMLPEVTYHALDYDINLN